LSACGLGGAATLSGSEVEKSITDSAGATLEGATVSKATCPESREVEPGDEFVCTVVIDGQEVPFRVVQDEGGYSYDVDGKVLAQDLTEYEDAAAAFVLQNEGVDVAADCGGAEHRTWLFVAAKTTVDCEVDYGDLQRGLRVDVARDGTVRNIVFTEARLDLGVVNDRVGQQLIGRLGGPFVLVCEDTFADETEAIALAPGEKFECVAVRNLAEVGTVRVEVKNVSGKLEATIV
jgi:hypothetical protein